tara:strand:+ start:212 stop:703 length:492 start_codon:yes stop_codon:yes gene_type:complete
MEYNYEKYTIEGNTATVINEGSTSYKTNYNSDKSFDYDMRENSTSSSRASYSREILKPALIKKMSVCNTYTSAITFDLYSYYQNANLVEDTDPRGYGNVVNDTDLDTFESCYLLKTVTIPVGTTLSLDFENDVCYDYEHADLYVQLGHSSYTADIVLKYYKTY